MAVDLMIMCVAILVASALVKRIGDRRELEQHTIRPEALHRLLASSRNMLVVDVRQPLDLLGDSVIIPGAVWFAPQQVVDDPSLLPRGRELIVYCTCPSDKTSRAVLDRSLALGFSRIRILKGGLDAWRAKGYPVEPYVEPFRLASSRKAHWAAAS
ncbi:MAG: rhodanese-like domain-containing protein [Terracidiphilus sp.]